MSLSTDITKRKPAKNPFARFRDWRPDAVVEKQDRKATAEYKRKIAAYVKAALPLGLIELAKVKRDEVATKKTLMRQLDVEYGNRAKPLEYHQAQHQIRLLQAEAAGIEVIADALK